MYVYVSIVYIPNNLLSVVGYEPCCKTVEVLDYETGRNSNHQMGQLQDGIVEALL